MVVNCSDGICDKFILNDLQSEGESTCKKCVFSFFLSLPILLWTIKHWTSQLVTPILTLMKYNNNKIYFLASFNFRWTLIWQNMSLRYKDFSDILTNNVTYTSFDWPLLQNFFILHDMNVFSNLYNTICEWKWF